MNAFAVMPCTWPPSRVVITVTPVANSPTQARNLERATGAQVLDRTGVILEIFHRHARSRQAAKRGGSDIKLPLEEAMIVSEGREVDLVALDEALERLAAIDPQQSRVVELRFFAGLSVKDIEHAMSAAVRVAPGATVRTSGTATGGCGGVGGTTATRTVPVASAPRVSVTE